MGSGLQPAVRRVEKPSANGRGLVADKRLHARQSIFGLVIPDPTQRRTDNGDAFAGVSLQYASKTVDQGCRTQEAVEVCIIDPTLEECCMAQWSISSLT